MTSEVKQSAPPRWREFFLLEQRLAAAQRTSFKTSDPGWPEFLLGRAALSNADQLAQSPDGLSSALVLYRTAVVLLARAQRARPAQPAAALSDAAAVLLPADEAALAALPDQQRAAVREALEANPPEEHLAKLSEEQRHIALQGMHRVARTLADSLDRQASAVARAKLQRWLRIGAAAGFVVLLVAWAITKILEPENLALGKSVSLSSVWTEGDYPAGGVVDGDRENIGFHTQCSRNQWVSVDLGGVKNIQGVEVFNRADCCQQRAVPLRLEVSTDGVQFTNPQRRTGIFDSWEIELPPTPARFVRLTNESANCFHLAEIEVY